MVIDGFSARHLHLYWHKVMRLYPWRMVAVYRQGPRRAPRAYQMRTMRRLLEIVRQIEAERVNRA